MERDEDEELNPGADAVAEQEGTAPAFWGSCPSEGCDKTLWRCAEGGTWEGRTSNTSPSSGFHASGKQYSFLQCLLMGCLRLEGVRATGKKHFVLAPVVSAVCRMAQGPHRLYTEGPGVSKVWTGAAVRESGCSLCWQTGRWRGVRC